MRGDRNATPEQVAEVLIQLEATGTAWVTTAELATRANVPPRTTMDAIARLRAMGNLIVSSSAGVRLAQHLVEAEVTVAGLDARMEAIAAARDGMKRTIARLRAERTVAA